MWNRWAFSKASRLRGVSINDPWHILQEWKIFNVFWYVQLIIHNHILSWLAIFYVFFVNLYVVTTDMNESCNILTTQCSLFKWCQRDRNFCLSSRCTPKLSNSFAPERWGSDFDNKLFKFIKHNSLGWMAQDLISKKSSFLQVLALCCQQAIALSIFTRIYITIWPHRATLGLLRQGKQLLYILPVISSKQRIMSLHWNMFDGDKIYVIHCHTACYAFKCIFRSFKRRRSDHRQYWMHCLVTRMITSFLL